MGHLVRLSYPEAPSGSWSIAQRGLSAAGTAYSDWDCTTPTTARALNSSGRATFYIATPSDLTIYDANGVAVDAFTEGARADLVDVRNSNWTGTLANGTQGLGGYLALESLLDNLAASFGSQDGYVLETSQSTPLLLKDSLKQIRSSNFPYVNVKSAPYNATGDGVTNDFPAIQAAINAAGANGVVLFPPGTYLTHSQLSMSYAGITLLGVSPFACTILYDAGSSFALTGVGAGMTVTNLGFNASAGGSYMSISDPSSSTAFTLSNCFFQNNGTSIPGAIGLGGNVVVSGNFSRATMSTAGRGLVEWTGLAAGRFIGNDFRNISGLGGAAVRIYSGSQAAASFIGNACANYLTCIDVSQTVCAFAGNMASNLANLAYCTANGADAIISEAGNTVFIPGSLSSQRLIQYATSSTGTVSAASRFGGLVRTSGTALTPNPDFFHNFIDATGNITVNAPSPSNYWDGAELVISIRNTTGGAVTVTWNAVYLAPPAANIAAGQTRVARFICKQTGSSPGWRYSIHADST